MSVFSAYWGGFLNFYSIWIFCLMQIVPFLVAFMVGSSISILKPGNDGTAWRAAFLAGAAPFAGFMAVFVSIGMVTTGFSKAIFRNMEMLNLFGGVFIGLVGFYLAGLLTIKSTRRLRAIRLASGFVLGAALGIAYKPCVTPTLTRIYNINTMPENVLDGAVLLVFYTLGISSAVMLVGFALVWLVSRVRSENTRAWIKKGCGGLILIASLLIVTDKMTYYKSFLVERFVPPVTGEGGHEGHSHETNPPGGDGHTHTPAPVGN